MELSRTSSFFINSRALSYISSSETHVVRDSVICYRIGKYGTNQVLESDTYTCEYGNNVFRDVEDKNLENDEDDILDNVIKEEISALRFPRVCCSETFNDFQNYDGDSIDCSNFFERVVQRNHYDYDDLQIYFYILKMISWRSTCERDYIEDARKWRNEEVGGWVRGGGGGRQGVTNVVNIVNRNMKDDRTELRFIVQLWFPTDITFLHKKKEPWMIRDQDVSHLCRA